MLTIPVTNFKKIYCYKKSMTFVIIYLANPLQTMVAEVLCFWNPLEDMLCNATFLKKFT